MLLRNCLIVNPQAGAQGQTTQGDKPRAQDVRLADGLIKEITTNAKAMPGEEIFDAGGSWLMPGLIDLHTHLRDFNQGAKEDVRTGTMAAAAGGYTTVVAMANTNPPVDSPAAFKRLMQIVAEKAVVTVLAIANVTKGMAGVELTEMGLLQELGAVGFSDDGLPVSNLAVMRRALGQARALDTLVVSHPEDKDLSGAGVMNESVTATMHGLAGVTSASEAVCIAREIELARITGARLHFAHVSTIASIKLIERGKADGLAITADTTPHHLTLTDADVLDFDTRFKMNPPLRSTSDQEALVKALAQGTIDAIGTDHAPHTDVEKESGFNAAPCGVTGLETAFALCLERLGQGGMSKEAILYLFTSAPANILKIKTPLIAVGATADLFVFNPDQKWTYDATAGHSRSKNSPFHGRTMTGRTTLTISRGKVAYQLKTAVSK
jgi:dihydroorotase